MKAILGRFIIAAAAVICSISMFCQHILADGRLPFDDINTSYAQKEIINLYNKKLITGTSLTSFSPAKSMTRAEFITVLERLLKLDPVASPVTAFTDVVMNEWYYGPIQAAVQLSHGKWNLGDYLCTKESSYKTRGSCLDGWCIATNEQQNR